MEKITVRKIIEMLAKGDWDSECTVIDSDANEGIQSLYDRKHFSHKIVGISQSTQTGTQIIFAITE